MARYLILWEIDPARVPTDAKERGTAWLVMVEMMKADMKKGVTKDWGHSLRNTRDMLSRKAMRSP